MSAESRRRGWAIVSLACMWAGILVGGWLGFDAARTPAESVAFTVLAALFGGVVGIALIVGVFVVIFLTGCAVALWQHKQKP